MLSLPDTYNSLHIVPPLADEYPYQRGVVTPEGAWYPLLSLKGYDLYNCYHRNILAAGSRKSSKTIGVGNRFMRHVWELDGAVAAVIAKTAKNAKIGVWRDLKNYILPGWVNPDFGMRIIKSGTDPATKMEFLIVSNMHGGTSEIQLHSLDYEPDVEEKFKSSRFSCIWLSEADQFKDRIVYDILEDQLRIIGIPYEKHMFIFDCNPPEEGDEHWLHDLFYKAAHSDSKFYREDYEELFKRFEFGLDDNPFLDPRERKNLEDKYRHDPIKFARFVEGKWVKDTSSGHFDDVFMYNIHVVGKADTADRSQWETITPHENVDVIVTGTDTGDLNHATSFLISRVDDRGEVCYDIFDEICSIEKKVSIKEFFENVWGRVEFWNKWWMETYKKDKPPQWRHWADSSLWNYSATADNNDAQIAYEVSDGGLMLRPAAKGRGSIKSRIAMTRRMFFSNRLNISAHCFWNIGWARFLKPGKTRSEPIKSGSPYTHGFSATTYALGSEIPHEMVTEEKPSTTTGIVTIG